MMQINKQYIYIFTYFYSQFNMNKLFITKCFQSITFFSNLFIKSVAGENCDIHKTPTYFWLYNATNNRFLDVDRQMYVWISLFDCIRMYLGKRGVQRIWVASNKNNIRGFECWPHSKDVVAYAPSGPWHLS